ncbi:sugar-binding domain-containing protein, partial [Lacrimispora sp.]
AIRASLKGGYLNVLITDEQTALNLMEEDPDSPI